MIKKIFILTYNRCITHFLVLFFSTIFDGHPSGTKWIFCKSFLPILYDIYPIINSVLEENKALLIAPGVKGGGGDFLSKYLPQFFR